MYEIRYRVHIYVYCLPGEVVFKLMLEHLFQLLVSNSPLGLTIRATGLCVAAGPKLRLGLWWLLGLLWQLLRGWLLLQVLLLRGLLLHLLSIKLLLGMWRDQHL